MITSSLKITASIIGLVVLLLGVRAVSKRMGIDPEWQRKLLHIGLGLFSLSFPFLFQHVWEVLILCLASAAVMLCIRFVPALRQSVGRSLYDVNRSSLGELLFAVTIVLLFWLSKDNLITYLIPMLILTVSDAAAAIIGVQYGRNTYDIEQGTKSWQGTAAFALFTFSLSVFLLDQLSDLPVQHCIIIAVILAWLGALVEAVSWHGIDNLVVPLGLYLLLERILMLDLVILGMILLMLIGLTAMGLTCAKISRLNVHALMAAIIMAFCFWIIGGINWLYPLLIVFLTHLFMAKQHPDAVLYDIRAILSVMFTALPWLLIYRVNQYEYSYYLYLLSLAIHWQINILISLRVIRRRPAEYRMLLATSTLATVLLLSMQILINGITAFNLMLVFAGALILFVGGILLAVNADRFSRERWLQQGLFSLLGSMLGIFPLQLMALTQ